MKLKNLKKEIGVLIICILSISNLYSQNEMRFGINAGANITDFNGQLISENADTKIGFLVGAYFDYYLTDNLSLKTNLNYERRILGSKLFLTDEFGNFDSENDFNVQYNYLALPILIKYDLGTSKQFYVNGGFTLDYLLNVSVKQDEFGDTSDSISQLDLNFTIGAGTYFHLNDKNDINLELRYSPHLTNVFKESNIPNPIQTNTISLVTSWNFSI